jgi:probable rRNA maturation factor
VNVQFWDEQEHPIDGDALRSLAERVLEAEGVPPDTEMSLMLVDAGEMGLRYREWTGSPGVTDVLSYPLADLEPGMPPRRVANGPPVALGDVLVCPAVVASRIEEEGLAPEDYGIERLVVHGILHLLGYDHGDDHSAEKMETREDELLGVVS